MKSSEGASTKSKINKSLLFSKKKETMWPLGVVPVNRKVIVPPLRGCLCGNANPANSVFLSHVIMYNTFRKLFRKRDVDLNAYYKRACRHGHVRVKRTTLAPTISRKVAVAEGKADICLKYLT